MSRFFFNEIEGEFKPDDQGVELASLDDARLEAVRYAAEVLRDRPSIVWEGDEYRIEVTNAEHLLLFTLIVVGLDAPAGGRSTNKALLSTK